MSLTGLREAQAKYEAIMPTIFHSRKKLHDLRKKFVRYFTLRRIRNLPINHYALGNKLLPNGLLFCHTLERGLDKLGRTTGATSTKFGVYYGKTKSDATKKYRFTKKFGNTLNTAYENIIESIVDLIEAGNAVDIGRISRNRLSPMFKGKILSTYYPDYYLNIFSNEHLNHFLIQLNLDDDKVMEKDEVNKRAELLKFKNQDSVMRNWSVDVFSHFLYVGYPGGPKVTQVNNSNDSVDYLEDFRVPEFPANPEPKIVELTILEPDHTSVSNNSSGNRRGNPDYEKQARRLKSYGDRGEKIVLDMERKRLLQVNRKDLADKIEKAKYDHLGYDILSWDIDGRELYIEVKATTALAGSATFFLTQNELQKSMELHNYHVYIVYDILSTSPKVWKIPNPFNPSNKRVVLTPITYRVNIKAKL
ncbi:MAG TPA: DUF3883 domain-containing protein [Verrucomicrobiae bacterium]|nr:DUF3883 domain-containing protein [Verrucomicrobiae bacterium]